MKLPVATEVRGIHDSEDVWLDPFAVFNLEQHRRAVKSQRQMVLQSLISSIS